MKQKLIAKMTGYKGTNANLRCSQGFQFEVGKWYEHEGDLALCESGFHFCKYPSGPACYGFSRLFECEAEDILELPVTPGADYKLVCRRIRLIKEVNQSGNKNTGNWNTGDRNTGNWNTGNGNTGDWNTGDRNTGNGNTGNKNTGDRNTGNGNTGNRNTGNRNTGYGNTGNRNTGNRNTGYGNTGYGNTGNWNTGNRNTGDGNAANCSTGFFCCKEPRVICFDKLTRYTRQQFLDKFPMWYSLCDALLGKDEIDFNAYKSLPGITRKKLKKLHAAHLAARRST